MDAVYRSDEGLYVLCPYCASPLTDGVERARLAAFQQGSDGPVPCNACALDVTRDAPLEVDDLDAATVDCRHCAHAIHAGALYCRHCRKWQSEPFERA